MAWPGGKDKATALRGPVLVVEGLDVHYGRAHVLQGVSFVLEPHPTAIASSKVEKIETARSIPPANPEEMRGDRVLRRIIRISRTALSSKNGSHGIRVGPK